MNLKRKKAKVVVEKERRLSPWRVLLGLLILAGMVSGATFGVTQWHKNRSEVSHKPWFAPYVDATAMPTFAFEQMGSNRDAILSFVVSSPSDTCTPSWGGAYTLNQASDSLDLDRRIARLKQQGGSVAVSFGGLKNKELAVGCTDTTKLEQAYKSVINRYDINTIDLDLERAGLTDSAAAARRATVIAQLQQERRAAGKSLAVWVTLPVTPQGLSEDGTNAITQLLSKHVDLAGVNIMTMDYGESIQGKTMLAASESALIQTQRQLGVLYQGQGVYLNNATLWSKLGATPMIGQNDNEKEIFNLEDAKGLNKFAHSHGIARMSMWSANRDLECGGNYINVKVVSDSCSGVKQAKLQFASLLGASFTGSLAQSAGVVTTADGSKDEQKPDDPKTSPYPIWSDSSAYLQGTKVVWHHNVYQAKWWTQGDTPDSPVLQSWQTPWELVGPVLPGEKPVAQATLPAGTYPEWSGDATYNTNQRILFQGVPYQAKWWNKGASPAAASSNPDSSPWVPLTQAQVNAIKANQ
jgi:chitinase